jgi:hypothetical protein
MVATGAVYIVAGLVNLFVYKYTEVEYIQAAWLLILLIPVLFPVNKLVRNAPFWKTK